MKMRPAWTCSSIGTSVLVADSLMEREKSLGQDSGVTKTSFCLQADCRDQKQHHMSIHTLEYTV